MSKKTRILNNPNLPDHDHIIRHVAYGRLIRDEDDNPVGIRADALRLRVNEEYLSVNWLEYYEDKDTQLNQSIWAMRQVRCLGGKSAFAIANVGKVKELCATRDLKVRIVHEPEDKNPGHAAVRRIARIDDDQVLLDSLAQDAFGRLVLNAAVPEAPASETVCEQADTEIAYPVAAVAGHDSTSK